MITVPSSRLAAELSGVTRGVRLSTLLSAGVLRRMAADPSVDPRVVSVEIYDPSSVCEPGSLVLGVGVDENTADLVAGHLSAHGAAALVLRHDTVTDHLQRRADLPLVVLADEVSWTSGFRTLHNLVSCEGSNELEELIREAEDLTELARNLATRIRNPLTIENMHGEVLAYSAHSADVDPARQETILTRKSPADVVARLRTAGLYRQINASPEPIRFSEDVLGVRSRIAMAIREGDRPLGHIWVLECGAPMGPEQLTLLRRAARLAASHIVRHRLERDVARRIRDELIGAIIRAEITSPARIAARAASVGLDVGLARDVLLVDLEPDPEEATERVEDMEQERRRRLLEVVSFEASAMHPKTVCASVAESVVVLVPRDKTQVARPGALARTIVRAASVARLTVSIGIGTPADDLAQLPRAHQHAEQALRVARRVHGGNTVIGYETLGVYKALAGTEVLGGRGTLSEPVESLLRYDLAQGTDYSQTLEAYLDQFGDRTRTARALNVHTNTLAYRLKRIEELAPIDLNDAEARLAAQLEFRARRLRGTSNPDS
jgi:sugar diacid utilization regulator